MLDLERLLALRLTVARYGEMDVARWWNTTHLLGPKGAAAVARGMPKTHSFARARAVFTVARERCREIYTPQGGVTLWDLPPQVEWAFEERWSHWLDHPEPLVKVFSAVASISAKDDLLALLSNIAGCTALDLQAAGKLKRASDQRAVPIGSVKAMDDSVVALLAAGFHRGEPGSPAVPFVKLDGGVE
jgi:hypothetical protein